MAASDDPLHVPGPGERPASARRLALGTRYLGVDPHGTLDPDGLKGGVGQQLLDAARDAGIQTLHTAADHGLAAEQVGIWAPDSWNPAVIHRAHSLQPDADPTLVPRVVRMGGLASMVRNGQRRLHGLLAGSAQDLTGPHGEAVWQALRDVQDEGLCVRIGVRIETREEWLAVRERCTPELVQAPLSVLDQRLLLDGTLAEMDRAGVELHASDVLHRGQALLPYTGRDPRIAARVERFHALCSEFAVTPLVAAIRFAVCQPNLHRVVITPANPGELGECIAAAGETFDPAPFLERARD